MEVLVGCDPELFIRDQLSRSYLSAYGMLPGTKQEPYKVKDGAVQIDGMATEFNIDPASTAAEFDRNITSVIKQMAAMLPAHVELCGSPVAIFEKAYFDGQPEKAKEFGCDPDYNAYTGKINKKPSTNKPMRTAGGHVHVGWTSGRDIEDPDHKEDCREVIRQLDVYLGVPSLMWDKNQDRRALYGMPGAYRVKPYGVEYRPLSCVWVCAPFLREYVFNATVGAVNDLGAGKVARELYGSTWARDIITSPYYRDNNYLSSFVQNGLPFFKKFDYKSFTTNCREFVYLNSPSVARGGKAA